MTLDSFFFFFQAEDGIRDYKVTGVQTCALPISGGYGMLIGPAASRGEIEDFRRALIANPGGYIAQPTLALSTDRKSTRLNSSHLVISYAVFCLKKKKMYHSSLTPPFTYTCPTRTSK